METWKIKTDFPGGNLRVLSQWESGAEIDTELRDTEGDWFYWCFRVEGAAGKTLTFRFPNEARVGYYGPAVSRDYETWRWQYPDSGHQGGEFTYTFGPEEHSVYFAHDMLCRPERFFRFAAERALPVETLCTSERGRAVPYLRIGSGEETILLTARHHACESTGSYVLEGVLDAMLADPYFERFHILCVPFTDYDGVVDGDQGKNRRPYDHNRDYSAGVPAIYSTTAAIRAFAESDNVRYAFDFHSPWHLGGSNDTLFIPVKSYEAQERIARFSELWQQENHKGALRHFAADDMPPDTDWNRSDAPTCSVFFADCGAELAFSVETPYFMADGEAYSPEKAIAAGENVTSALKQYIG